eukprot:750522-Hanusia_phi.AAC.1
MQAQAHAASGNAAAAHESPYLDLEVVTKHGVSRHDMQGVCHVESVLYTVKKNLLLIKGITEAKIDKVLEAIQKEKENICFISLQIGSDESLGVKGLDALLGGGLESSSITEIYGEFRTGKTQWVHTLAVTAMLPAQHGGGEGKVAIIDTEVDCTLIHSVSHVLAKGAFRPGCHILLIYSLILIPLEKIAPIAERFGVDCEAVLNNLLIARAYNTDHQMNMIRDLAAIMMEEGPFAILIIDSMTSLFRVDYVGRGELSARQQSLGQMLSKITKMAEEFNVAVLITNQVMSNPDGGMTFVSDPKKPVGGHVLAHASTTRLELKKGRGDCRICKVVDSPSQPEAEASYQ